MIRWAYAINQFKPQFDNFTRRRDHLRALRVVSISGFRGIELSSGTGRWEPLGNPAQIAANFGSIAGFAGFVRDCDLDAVSSWYWDPFHPHQEDLSGGTDPADADARDMLIAHARWYASALSELGGSILVVRPTASAWATGRLGDDALDTIAASWDRVGEAVAEFGIRLALHVDFLSALRLGNRLDALLARTDARHVGLAVDTAEFAVAGIDPIDVIRTHRDRVVHVHLKNAAARDEDDEFLMRNAEQHLRRAGGTRRVERWFLELGTQPRLVDAEAAVRALVDIAYDGWIVVESDFSPHPPTSTMLNGWEIQHVLAPLIEASTERTASR